MATKIETLYGWTIERDNWIIFPEDIWLEKYYKQQEKENFKCRYLAGLDRMYLKSYISIETLKNVRANLKIKTPIKFIVSIKLQKFKYKLRHYIDRLRVRRNER